MAKALRADLSKLLHSMKIVWDNFVIEGGDGEAEIPRKLKLFVSLSISSLGLIMSFVAR